VIFLYKFVAVISFFSCSYDNKPHFESSRVQQQKSKCVCLLSAVTVSRLPAVWYCIGNMNRWICVVCSYCIGNMNHWIHIYVACVMYVLAHSVQSLALFTVCCSHLIISHGSVDIFAPKNHAHVLSASVHPQILVENSRIANLR